MIAALLVLHLLAQQPASSRPPAGPAVAAPPAPVLVNGAPAPSTPADEEITSEPTRASPMDSLAPAPVVRPFEMPAYAPVTPMPYGRVAPDPKSPVSVERYHGDYEPPKDELQSYYEQGVRGRFLSEQALRGPLDGVWTLTDAEGHALYSLVLNDPGLSGGLEAAWRSLTRSPGPLARGVADMAGRTGGAFSLSFTDPDTAGEIRLTLRQDMDGRWRGELVQGARRLNVVMSRQTTPS